MRSFPSCCTIVLLAIVVGCEHDCFEVEVRPDGEGFDRKLTCWHVGGKEANEIRRLSEEQLSQIREIYPQCETPEDAIQCVFSGRFTETTPADVGGAGRYTHFTSPLGSTSSYVERFRGSDDLEANLSQRRQAADQLTDLLIGWLTAELGQDPNFAQLNEFLNKDLRQDLKNLGLYAWAGAAADRQAERKGEFLFRAGLYLCERGYFSPQQIPLVCRSVMTQDMQPLLAHLQRLLARKMGVDDNQPVPASLAFLADASAAETSFNKHAPPIARIPRPAPARKTKTDAPQAKQKAPENETVGSLLGMVVGLDSLFMSGSEDALDLKLFCGQKPYATDGAWDGASQAVTWTKPLAMHFALPVVCFAAWSTPDAATQEKHFGKVVLADEALMKFVVWYRLLKPEEAKEWGQFIDRLDPGSDLKAAIEAFRFSTDPKPNPEKPDEKPASLADSVRALLLEGL